jgi:hypothetical protein
MKIIVMVSLLIVASVGPVPSWAGPVANLLEPGEVRVMGIDHIAKAVQSEPERFRRSFSADWAGQDRYQPGQTSPYEKPSVIELLSDNVTEEKTVQTERNRYGKLVPSSADQYVSAEYFPTSPGTTWTYVTDGSKTSKVKIYPELATVRGVETNVVVNTDTGVGICYTSDSKGILIHRQLTPNVYIQGTGTVDLLVTFIPPIRLADGLVEVGQTAYSIGTAQYRLLPRRRVFDLAYTASYTLQALNNISVPAGVIEALVFQGTFTLLGDFESETFYLAKGLGLIKDEIEVNTKKRTKELSFSNTGS